MMKTIFIKYSNPVVRKPLPNVEIAPPGNSVVRIPGKVVSIIPVNKRDKIIDKISRIEYFLIRCFILLKVLYKRLCSCFAGVY